MSKQQLPRFSEGPGYSYATGELTLLAYLAFKRPKQERYNRLIPKDPEAWLEFQVQLVKRKKNFQFLSEKDIRKTIRITKPHMGKKKAHKPERDPDLPDCHFWDEDDVGTWLDSVGFSHLKETFKKNCITGRKLVTVDASALNKMGLQYFSEIKEVAAKIREVLGVHTPNMMRAIMRRPPFIDYLDKCRFTGDTYEFLTFKKFCESNKFPYEVIQYNPCALIDCCCQLLIKEARTKITSQGLSDGSSTDSSGGSSNSIHHIPSVEFTVRHMVVRNKVITDIINELLDQVSLPRHLQKYGPDAIASRQRMHDILEYGFSELGLSDEELWARIEFAKEVADGLIEEVRKTQRILQDIQAFKKMLNDKTVSSKEIEHLREVATDFFDAVATVGALLAFGEFELENIFRQEPEFEEFVDEIVDEAENVLNERVSSADAFVRDVIEEARNRLMAKELNLSLTDMRAVKSYAAKLVDKMIKLAFTCVDGTTTRSQIDLSQDDNAYFDESDPDHEYSSGGTSHGGVIQAYGYYGHESYAPRESGESSGTFLPGSGSLTDLRFGSSSSQSQLAAGGGGNYHPLGGSSSKSQLGSSKSKSNLSSKSRTKMPAGVRSRHRRGFVNSSTTIAGGDTTAEEERTTTSEYTTITMSSAGEGNSPNQWSSPEAPSSNEGKGQGQDGETTTTTAKRSSDPNFRRSIRGKDFVGQSNSSPGPGTHASAPGFQTRAADPGFERAGMHRTDFVETWAQDTDYPASEAGPEIYIGLASDKATGQLSDEEQARLVRMTADQVVTNVLERALLRLLRDAEGGSGLHTEQILDALEQLRQDRQAFLEENGMDLNPYNINNEILRLWTPTVLSRTLDVSTAQAGPSVVRSEGAIAMQEVLSSGIRMPAPPGYRYPLEPPHGTQSRAHLYEKKKSKKDKRRDGNRDRECTQSPCDTPEVVCSYPILIQAMRK